MTDVSKGKLEKYPAEKLDEGAVAEQLQTLSEKVELKPREVTHVFWTGGFDSTSIILGYLKERRTVQPIYMQHSRGWAKCEMELQAQQEIREYLGSPSGLLPSLVWHHDTLSELPAAKPLVQALDELASAIGISYQYSALRLCRDLMGWNDKPIELGIVEHDELWEKFQSTCSADGKYSKALMAFFAGFEFPIFTKSKKDLWMEATPQERDLLKKTFCCENSDGERRSCTDRGVTMKNRCGPCKRRIEALW